MSVLSPGICTIDDDCPVGYYCDGGVCFPLVPPVDPGAPALPGLGNYLIPRYTSNLIINDEISGNDLINKVINAADRGFLVQMENGAVGYKNKKPTPYAFATDAIAVSDDEIAVDNVKDWIGTDDTLLLVNPHTSRSEVRTVIDAAYSTDQNSATVRSTGGIFTTVDFSGCDGLTTPATGSITVDSATGTDCSITINDPVATTFSFTTGTNDTVYSIASYIAAAIMGHPVLRRKYDVEFDGVDTVTITARFGILGLDDGVRYASDAPLADPVTAPTLGQSGSATDLAAGDYAVAYCAVNDVGDTLLSQYKVVALSALAQIDVSTISLPAGATSVKWFVSPAPGSTFLRLVNENNGTGFAITTLPKLSAALPPDTNTTGAEVMRIAGVFSDREEDRSGTTRANVLKATFEWKLGGRAKAVNQIELVYRDATNDYARVTMKRRNDESIAKLHATKSESINGQAIDNTDQAERIASGALAELRDADFFHKWKSTNEASLFQEGDVVATTDSGAGLINFPVIIEEIEMDVPTCSLPEVNFTARTYAYTLYDDSIVERTISLSLSTSRTTGSTWLLDEDGEPLLDENGNHLYEG